MNAPPTFDLAAITGIVQKGLDSRQRELAFRIVVGQLHTYITAHAPDAESLEACVAHANQCLGEWPAVTRVAEKRWWMIIEETEIVNDWDSGELFRGWRIPPDWRARLARKAVIRMSDLDLRGEAAAGLFANTALGWLEELSIEHTVGPDFVAALIGSGTLNHLKVLDLHFSGLSKAEMNALKDWRKRHGIVGVNQGYKYS
ncbi:MAG: hypothetical protein U0176_12590 [Bacteroidia bacterium]